MNYTLLAEDLDYVLHKSSQDLALLNKAHIFMTGCTGFFGKWLVESLLFASEKLSLGIQITLLSRNPERFLAEMPHLSLARNLHFIQGDIRSFDEKKSVPFEYLIHGAVLSYESSNNWAYDHIIDGIEGTKKVLDLAKKYDTKKVLFLSSGAVYGQNTLIQNREFEENDCKYELTGASIYGKTKSFLELFINSYSQAKKIDISIARAFAFSGAYLPLDKTLALGNFVNDAIHNRDIIIKSDGSAIRSYMYGADLVVWLLAILLRAKNQSVYNVGSEEKIIINDLARLVATCSGGKVKVKVLNQSNISNAPNMYIPNVNLARNDLQLECSYDIEKSIKNMLKWIRKC